MGTAVMRRRDHLALAVVLAVLAGAAVLTCAAAVGVALLAPRPKPAQRYERDELRTLLIGKTKEEVIGAMGRPDRTADGDDDWTYYDRTYDRVSGRGDGITTVQFRGGRVVRVHSF